MSAITVLRVELIKNLALDGPIILPVPQDVPYLAQPLTCKEMAEAQDLADGCPGLEIEQSLPIAFVGTGANLNIAIDNGLERAAGFLGISVGEVKNRATITGSIEIGRAPGVVTVTLRAPVGMIKNTAFAQILKGQYA